MYIVYCYCIFSTLCTSIFMYTIYSITQCNNTTYRILWPRTHAQLFRDNGVKARKDHDNRDVVVSLLQSTK